MKVVKRGKKYKEITCDFCEAIIAYEDNEVQVEGVGSLSNSKENNEGSTWTSKWPCDVNTYIICPECNHKIYIGEVVNTR